MKKRTENLANKILGELGELKEMVSDNFKLDFNCVECRWYLLQIDNATLSLQNMLATDIPDGYEDYGWI